MRGAGVALSVVVHATLAIAWLAGGTARPASAPRHVAPAPEDPPPIEVVVLEPMREVAPSPIAETPIRAATPRTTGLAMATSTRGATGTPTARPGAEPGPPTTTPGPPTPAPRPSLLHMRWGPQYVSSMEGLLDQAAGMPAGEPPPQLVPSGMLRPDGGGTMRGTTSEFDARVARDGSVALRDGPNVRLGPRRGPPVEEGGNTPIVSFDVTDALMRRHGLDPYASAKRKFLDATRAERVEMGLAYRAQQLAHTAPLMEKNIARALATIADPAGQRRALFELWDDCAETGPEPLVEAGRVGRALVLGVIRTRFPAGGPRAYGEAEIVELSRHRTSKAAFAPYTD